MKCSVAGLTTASTRYCWIWAERCDSNRVIGFVPVYGHYEVETRDRPSEFRVLRRILNLAVKYKRLTVNPCQTVEFPVRVSNTTRKPHYMTASEQARIEFFAPSYLRQAVVILVEMGLRPYREMTPIEKQQVDLENRVVHISDSKTPNGVADMPMTDLAYEAFKARIEETLGSDYLFPTSSKRATKPYITALKKVWTSTLERAGVTHFPIDGYPVDSGSPKM